MGLPDLKLSFDNMAEVARSRPAAPTGGEVLNFARGTINRAADSCCDLLNQYKVRLITANRECRIFIESYSTEGEDLSEIPAVIASINNLRNVLQDPVLVPGTTSSISSRFDEIAVKLAVRSSGEGRFGRRVAKRVRDAEDEGEIVRQRFFVLTDKLIALLRQSEKARFINEERGYALLEASLAAYPKVTEYLAR